MEDTFGEGVAAFRDGLARNRNPYADPTSEDAIRWDDAWCWMRDREPGLYGVNIRELEQRARSGGEQG